jgi:hypothetical protein
VLILDGFSHLRGDDHVPDADGDASKMLKFLHSETDDEGEDDGEDKSNQIQEEKPEQADELNWNCPICTFENPFSVALC